MRAVIWSLAVTAVAAFLFVIGNREVPATQLKWMGASGGALLAVAGMILGILRPGAAAHPPARGAVLPRYFQERRRSPRHPVDIPVRLCVSGRAYDAKLVSISSSGALLRLHPRPGEPLAAQVGQPVTIQDYPAGTLARVGPQGLYVEFAVAFDAAHAHPDLEAAGRSAG